MNFSFSQKVFDSYKSWNRIERFKKDRLVGEYLYLTSKLRKGITKDDYLFKIDWEFPKHAANNIKKFFHKDFYPFIWEGRDQVIPKGSKAHFSSEYFSKNSESIYNRITKVKTGNSYFEYRPFLESERYFRMTYNSMLKRFDENHPYLQTYRSLDDLSYWLYYILSSSENSDDPDLNIINELEQVLLEIQLQKKELIGSVKVLKFSNTFKQITELLFTSMIAIPGVPVKISSSSALLSSSAAFILKNIKNIAGKFYFPFARFYLKPASTLSSGGLSPLKVAAWIKRSTWNKVIKSYHKEGALAFSTAMKKGIVAPKGNTGIVQIRKQAWLDQGFTHKIKTLGKYGDSRILGKFDKESGHYVFSRFILNAH